MRPAGPVIFIFTLLPRITCECRFVNTWTIENKSIKVASTSARWLVGWLAGYTIRNEIRYWACGPRKYIQDVPVYWRHMFRVRDFIWDWFRMTQQRMTQRNGPPVRLYGGYKGVPCKIERFIGDLPDWTDWTGYFSSGSRYLICFNGYG